MLLPRRHRASTIRVRQMIIMRDVTLFEGTVR